MQFRWVGLTLLLVSTTLWSQGRKPAVEDFVGIEVEQTAAQDPSKTSENLYNLEQDMNKVRIITTTPTASNVPTIKVVPNRESTPTLPISALAGFLALLTLPLLSWFFMMRHLKNKASIENANNIEILEKYRQERLKNQKAKEDIKKAS